MYKVRRDSSKSVFFFQRRVVLVSALHTIYTSGRAEAKRRVSRLAMRARCLDLSLTSDRYSLNIGLRGLNITHFYTTTGQRKSNNFKLYMCLILSLYDFHLLTIQ